MARTLSFRLRRSAAQMHALAQVEREIRANDPHVRRKYLREFSAAFRTYESVLTAAEMHAELASADVVLIGDYHTLPNSQRFAARVAEQLAAVREVVVAVETIFASDQPVVEAWMAGEISEEELRLRTRFDSDWGYDWQPFSELLASARAHSTAVYGLDCMPRGDLRRIVTRDRHAGARLAAIRERHPKAVVIALFGESHLAPGHLPREIRQRRPLDRIVTVLQNIDDLYWQAIGEPADHVEAVRVNDGVLCVFNSTPLEKYESYRLYLERWKRVNSAALDLAPTFYNIIDALLRSLNIDKYSLTAQRELLVDSLPEVYCRASEEQCQKLLSRKGLSEQEQTAVIARVRARGACYVPQLNAILAREFVMLVAAEEAARFVWHMCGRRRRVANPDQQNAFYVGVIERALVCFGARVLCPTHPARREADLYSMYALDRGAVEQIGMATVRGFMELIDFLVLHKDYEASARHYREIPPLVVQGVLWEGCRREYATEWLGDLLGGELYDAYIHGRVGKRFLRSLFTRDLSSDARTMYFLTARRIRKAKRRLLA